MKALDVGVDGLAHLFIDQPHTDQVVKRFRETGAFVTPYMVLNASIMEFAPRDFAEDERVKGILDKFWLKTLSLCFNT